MYTYLTGAASWYMLTLVTEVFGAGERWATWYWIQIDGRAVRFGWAGAHNIRFATGNLGN